MSFRRLLCLIVPHREKDCTQGRCRHGADDDRDRLGKVSEHRCPGKQARKPDGCQYHAFEQRGTADVKERSFDEHMFLEMQDGALRVFVRTKYGIGAADSYDGGVHFGEDFDTGYKGPNSRFHIRRLPSGRVLLINHYDYCGRNNLTAMLSEDDGKTFPYRLLLDERSNVSYPDAAIDAEGRIHITYDRERGANLKSPEEVMGCAREILTACISEEDILKGALVNSDSYLKHVAFKLTDYEGDASELFPGK